MADIRTREPVAIVDKTTPTQGAAVDGSGNLQVKVGAALPTGGNTIGNVGVTSLPGSLTGKAEDAAAADADVGLPILGVRNDAAAARTGTDGDYGMVALDSAGRVGVSDLGGAVSVDDNGGSLTVDGTVAVSGTVTVDSELPSAAALADATANPTIPSVGADLLGFNGTTWDRVRTANTGRLQVDVITGGGSTTPTTPVIEALTVSATAAGATANMDSLDIATKKLWAVDVTSSVAFKAIIQILANSVATSKVVLFGQAGQLVSWRTPHTDFIVSGGATAGTDGFRIAMTNMDASEAADGYASIYYAS